jgi:single-strand DNA-binding protein
MNYYFKVHCTNLPHLTAAMHLFSEYRANAHVTYAPEFLAALYSTLGIPKNQLITIKNKNNMSNLRNSVRLIGNLGAAPEVKSLEKGNKVARINLATNESYKNAQGEKVTDTCWHNLVAWGKTADIVEKYLEKGSEIAIEGKLTSRSYNNKEGEKKYITEIVVNDILMLSKKN